MACLCLMFAAMLQPANANAETRSLKLYYLHTGEKADIVFKRNGRYDAAGLKKLNWFLRDWRRNEPTKMNPLLFDLIWEAYRESGSKGYIHVISGYRSPATNEMLRRTRGGQAKKSQHMLGNAMDFFLPDVKLAKIREIGLKMQVGGVGYYPKSGSPFVHLDVGSVRHWPRMSRSELARVFPDGKSLHIPADGKPLSGYKAAVASYEQRKRSGNLVPNSGSTKGASGLFAMLKGNSTPEPEPDDEEDTTEVAANNTPAPRSVAVTKLPGSVPVPETAPRTKQLETGREILLATLPPQDPPALPEQQPAEEEPAATAQEEEAPASALAMLASIPVPERRPEDAPAIAPEIGTREPDTLVAEAASSETQEEPKAVFESLEDNSNMPETETEIAQAEPAAEPDQQAENSKDLPSDSAPDALALLAENSDSRPAVSELAALTPREIEDLRRAAVPRSAIGVSNAATSNQIELAALAPADLPEAVMTEVPLPTSRPENEKATEETASLEPIEPGVKRTGLIAVPEANPVLSEKQAEPEMATATELAAVDRNETQEQPAAASNIPVPEPNPSLVAMIEPSAPSSASEESPAPTQVAGEPQDQPREIVMASLEDEQIDRSQPETGGLAARTISLDPLSAPERNAAVVGRWALAKQPTVDVEAPVQAPAYGRNMIRQVPADVPVTGFSVANAGNPYSGFSGKAVRFTKFAKLIR
ncbi:MAG: DUF882 domain-containing protein [Nitratireductor sp.]|nr:DUF882 domain-containing protein [Nitratireductor sp.]